MYSTTPDDSAVAFSSHVQWPLSKRGIIILLFPHTCQFRCPQCIFFITWCLPEHVGGMPVPGSIVFLCLLNVLFMFQMAVYSCRLSNNFCKTPIISPYGIPLPVMTTVPFKVRSKHSSVSRKYHDC